MRDEDSTVTLTKAGMQGIRFRVGDEILLDGKRLAVVKRVDGNTQILIGPASVWQRVRFWFSERLFDIKISWWHFQATWRSKWRNRRK
jgi:hypothetical protein